MILIIGIIGSGGYIVFEKYLDAYKLELNTLKGDLAKNVYISNKKLISGTIISKDDFYLSQVYSSLGQEQYISEEDMGKILVIDVGEAMPILKDMVKESTIQNDLREEELNMLLLPSNLVKNQYIDIRLGFPNGEDYIVLSKKKIQEVQLANNTIWLWVDEKEILMLSSAIVDAYLHKGSKLYTVTYVEPAVQEKAILTYPVNHDVLKVIKADPNILEEAKKALSEEARTQLEARLLDISEAAISSMESGVKEESSNRDTKIANEQEHDSVQSIDTIVPQNLQEEKGLNNKEAIESDTFY